MITVHKKYLQYKWVKLILMTKGVKSIFKVLGFDKGI